MSAKEIKEEESENDDRNGNGDANDDQGLRS